MFNIEENLGAMDQNISLTFAKADVTNWFQQAIAIEV